MTYRTPTIAHKTAKTALAAEASDLIDRSGIIATLEDWAPDSGRASFDHRTMLTVWLMLALEGRPLNVAESAHLVRNRLSPGARQRLGLPTASENVEATYRRLRRASARITDALDGGDGGDRETRLPVFANAFLNAQYREVPASAKTTAMDVFVTRHFQEGRGGHIHVTPSRPARRGWAYDVVTLSSPSSPHVVLGLNQQAIGSYPSRMALPLFDSLGLVGMTFGTVVASRAYFPGPLLDYLRERDIPVVMNDPRHTHEQRFPQDSRPWRDAYTRAMRLAECLTRDLDRNPTAQSLSRRAARHAVAMTLAAVATNRRRIITWNSNSLTTPDAAPAV